MTLHLHHLWGCAPAPLAHYLKALGILRLVSQQKDPEARGFWKDEHFCLVTSLDREGIERFFLQEYAPTPVLSPWNKGSGFFTKNDSGIEPIERSVGARFEAYRQGIVASRAQLDVLTPADAEVRRLKDTTKQKGLTAAQRKALRDDPAYKATLAAAEREFKRLKADLFAPFARTWRGEQRAWMDAAMVLDDEGQPTWPALLGTGGNDGRLDFTNNLMQHLGRLFDLGSTSGAAEAGAASLLCDALWATGTRGVLANSVGQYLPGNAGGANASTGPDGAAYVNPWDFVLMLEGAVCLRSQATRRLDTRAKGRAAVPFALHTQAVGHGTRGREKAERGEQWLPLWESPTTSDDLLALLGEGRAQVQRSNAQRPLDFARAIAKLGVARGLVGFQRYGYLERNGQSNIAVPLGRLDASPRIHAALIDDLAPWLDRLQRVARDDNAGARLSAAEGNLSDSIFDCLTAGQELRRWQAVLTNAARVEALQVSGTAFQAGPIPRLSAGWLDAADDGSPEWRLAVALGSAATEYKAGRRAVDPIRSNVLPLDERSRYRVSEKRLINDHRVVVTGRNALSDLATLVERRLIEAAQRGQRYLPLVACPGFGAQLTDLAAFLDGDVDVERTLWLARALMALDWGRVRGRTVHARGARPIDEAWVALRLSGTPFEVAGRWIPLDLATVRRLVTGDVAGAMTVVLRRLRAAGLRPPIVSATADASTALRWAAALAFPIEPSLVESVTKQFLAPTDHVQNQMEIS